MKMWIMYHVTVSNALKANIVDVIVKEERVNLLRDKVRSGVLRVIMNHLGLPNLPKS